MPEWASEWDDVEDRMLMQVVIEAELPLTALLTWGQMQS